MDPNEQMKQQLLARTKASYERREGDSNDKYFKEDIGAKFWKAVPTKAKPHIIDIIPFRAGNNFPKTDYVKKGEWAYCLDLYVHSNVGPMKKMVVCPAKNYGNPCPICDEVEEQIRQGVDWNDIPFTPVRRVVYNILVMDDNQTEAEGLQIWERPHSYFEKIISGMARSAREGGYTAFASTTEGRSIAFEVGSDKYRKITGHRFENRNYVIPTEMAEAALPLDELIVVYTAEEIKMILWGGAQQGPVEDEADVKDYVDPAPTQGRSLRVSRGQAMGEALVPDTSGDQQPSAASSKPSLRPSKITYNECPVGAKFGEEFDSYAECSDDKLCAPDCRQACAEEKDRLDLEKKREEEKAKPTAGSAPGGRRVLTRK